MDQLSNTECAKCLEQTQVYMAMRCQHHLCLQCAGKLIKQVAESRKINILNSISCQICGILTAIKPQTIEELLPKVQISASNLNEVDQQRQLFCFTCLSKCFSIQHYLQGNHKTHDVKNIKKSYINVKQLLQDIQDKLQNKIQIMVIDSGKVAQKKRSCIQQLTELKTNIRGSFQQVRKRLDAKQAQIQRQAQSSAQKAMQTLDRASNQIKKFIMRLEHQQQMIRKHLNMQFGLVKSMVQCLDFYSQQRPSTIQLIRQASSFQLEKLYNSTQVNCSIDFDQVLDKISGLKAVKAKIQSLQIQDSYLTNQWHDRYFSQAKLTLRNSSSRVTPMSMPSQSGPQQRLKGLYGILRNDRLKRQISPFNIQKSIKQRFGFDRRLRRIQRFMQ